MPFLNGIAIFAVELKCNTSGQNYENAINQYKHERDPHTRLFKSKAGVFAAFAMDLDEVYFCTSLRGVNSSFLPFNIGMPKSPDKPYSIGKGNPHNENGINVSYMWEQIWTKEKIILLIERFIFIEKKKEKNTETGRTKVKETVIFPRYHQLRAVERLVADSVSDALVAGYDENVDFYTLLLGNEELRDKITEVYMTIYSFIMNME